MCAQGDFDLEVSFWLSLLLGDPVFTGRNLGSRIENPPPAGAALAGCWPTERISCRALTRSVG